ncbi:hypothetical protein BT96DRAFT_1026133 [Gymnopus androsaceus JB14]|uniref:F-box domain-containing protein n=1 Tax=Gymnopus androsaceus JB14 TaxID=1447944 RepID=A0A6A4GMY1_9AGAR|nr:hypothetical protein BT96DRAFT_1026133 [Gymnopus androsaceus JB14]
MEILSDLSDIDLICLVFFSVFLPNYPYYICSILYATLAKISELLSKWIPWRRTQPKFRPRTNNVDFSAVGRRLLSEHGTAIEAEEEIFATLALIEQDLDDCKAESDCVQAKIHRLQSEIRPLHFRTIVLEYDRQRLERHKARLRSLRSPFRRLPNELVLLIFTFVCDMNELTSRKLVSMPTLNISAVCSRWRDLTRSSPELWSAIRLRMGPAPCDLRLLDFYLHCSQQSPLSLEFKGNKLETLEPHHLANAPNLRSLFAWIGDVQIHKFPWKQLTTLVDIGQCDAAIGEVLERCSNLKELHFHVRGGMAFKACIPPVTVASVEKLMLELLQSESAANVFLESITCPSLNSLLIEDRSCKHPWPKNELNAFLSRSSCHLTTLYIKSMPLSDLDLIDLLQRIPTLLHLTIDDSNVPLGEESHNAALCAKSVRLPSHNLRYSLLSSVTETAKSLPHVQWLSLRR